MGKALIINTSKISIEQESRLEEFLNDNNHEYKEDSFTYSWKYVGTRDDCEECEECD